MLSSNAYRRLQVMQINNYLTGSRSKQVRACWLQDEELNVYFPNNFIMFVIPEASRKNVLDVSAFQSEADYEHGVRLPVELARHMLRWSEDAAAELRPTGRYVKRDDIDGSLAQYYDKYVGDKIVAQVLLNRKYVGLFDLDPDRQRLLQQPDRENAPVFVVDLGDGVPETDGAVMPINEKGSGD